MGRQERVKRVMQRTKGAIRKKDLVRGRVLGYDTFVIGTVKASTANTYILDVFGHETEITNRGAERICVNFRANDEVVARVTFKGDGMNKQVIHQGTKGIINFVDKYGDAKIRFGK